MTLESKVIDQYIVYFRNREELERIYHESFERKYYQFKTTSTDPFIIDCGSHIGISILYFKSIYPKAKILGFEPNPENYEILKKNISENKLRDVEVVNAALSDYKGEAVLYASKEKPSPWTWGDTIIPKLWDSNDDARKISVRKVKLSDYINGKVNFLKMDIEGSEGTVLEEIKNKLRYVEQMTIEFHSTKTNKQTNDLNKIRSLLRNGGFKLKIISDNPLVHFPGNLWKYSKRNWIGIIRAIK